MTRPQRCSTVRTQADADMASSPSTRSTRCLTKFEEVNTMIVKRHARRSDITDHLDQRDKIIADLSQEIGIKTQARGDNDIVIFTDSGVTLFETRARTVTFEPTRRTTPRRSATRSMSTACRSPARPPAWRSSGRLAGLAAVRDDYAPRYQSAARRDRARADPELRRDPTRARCPRFPMRPAFSPGRAHRRCRAAASSADSPAKFTSLRASTLAGRQCQPAARWRHLPGNPAYKYNTTERFGLRDRLQRSDRRSRRAAGLRSAARGLGRM